MIIFFKNPVLIINKYELIDSTHPVIADSCSSYEASICVGMFLKMTTGSQYKGSSIVELSNSSRRGTWHIPYAFPSSQISAWLISFLNKILKLSKRFHVQEVKPKFEPLTSHKYYFH